MVVIVRDSRLPSAMPVEVADRPHPSNHTWMRFGWSIASGTDFWSSYPMDSRWAMGKSRSNAAISAPSAITLLPSGERDEHRASCFGKDGLAKVIQPENGTVEIQWIAFVGVDDVACIHRPSAVEFGPENSSASTSPRRGVARREGKRSGTCRGGSIEVVELRERAIAPLGRANCGSHRPRRIVRAKERRPTLEAVERGWESVTGSGADAGVHAGVMRNEQVQIRGLFAANDALDEVADDSESLYLPIGRSHR